jgi:hypothetical protein
VSSQQQDRTSTAAQVLLVLLTVGLQFWVIWVQLPPQQRTWIRLAAAGRVRRIAAMGAWSEGQAGMGEELQTGQKSIRYATAYSLSLLRDRAQRILEEMKL